MKKKFKYLSIPCEHETNEVDISTILDDYHPLSEQQIKELLNEALRSENPSSQQVRLNQAIPGITCPRPSEGIISDKITKVDNYFTIGLKRGYWSGSQRHAIAELCGCFDTKPTNTVVIEIQGGCIQKRKRSADCRCTNDA